MDKESIGCNIPAEPVYENISLIWYDKSERVDHIMIISLIEVPC
jgi:hypothetical protein